MRDSNANTYRDGNSYAYTDDYAYGHSDGNALSDAYVLTRRFARAMDTGCAGGNRSLRRLHGQRWDLCL